MVDAERFCDWLKNEWAFLGDDGYICPMKVANWGNYPVAEAELVDFRSEKEVPEKTGSQESWIPRGLGRCYGDSSLAEHILSTTSFNRFLGFDEQNGLLTVQSGVSLADVLEVIVPKGWFLPVTPGTKFVTVGGAIAADVHGKNHHSEGTFSRYVKRFSLLTPGAGLLECSPVENAEVFWATCGGMGLTGLIMDATFSLKKIETSYIRETSLKVKNLDQALEVFEQSMGYTYSVAWLDCLAKGKNLGRSIILNGEHAGMSDLKKPKHLKTPLIVPQKRKFNVPFKFPSFTMNSLSIKAFNAVFYAKAPRGEKTHVIDYDTYFYPLDSIHHWNRVYGQRGFAQYQFVMPPETAVEGLKKVLEKTSKERFPSFLTVLKWCGDEGKGHLSFPLKGLTLAMDFPRSKSLFPFLDELDKIVLDAGGRLYLTKDCRMSSKVLAESYPRLKEWEKVKKIVDPNGNMQSLQSKRLKI